MAEEKKPKIDLKARLGKAQAAAGGAAPAGIPAPAIPPPVATGSIPTPAGVVPPPVVSPSGVPAPMPGIGVPVPPFATPSKRPSAVDASDPFGSVAASEAPRPAPAAIKIEIGEEVVAAQQRASKKTVAIAAIVGVFAGIVGYVAGGSHANSEGAKIAMQGAVDLVGEVEKSQAKVKELNDKIGEAIKSLKDKKFPDSFANDLGGISIPFGADKLAGRNIGRFPPNVLNLLVNYASSVDTLNDRKDALKNLFAGQKQGITDALAAADNPKVLFNVFVQKSPAHGPIAVLAAVNPKDAWAYKDKDWPSKYKISTGRELVDVERWGGSGDVWSSDKKVVTVPLDPDSVASAFPNDIIVRVTSELAKTGQVLAGKQTGSPDDDDSGVIKTGENLLTELKKIGKR